MMGAEYERAAAALAHLDPSCPREQWVKIGMAAKAAGLGFEDWHAWSIPAANYRSERDCLTVWNSFSETGKVSAASLFHLAFSAGWVDPAKRSRGVGNTPTSRPTPLTKKAPVSPIASAETERASQVWEVCMPATGEHPYILRKQGSPAGLRVYPLDAPPLFIRAEDVRGWLAVPCRDLSGRLLTIQFVPSQGDKLNLPGASFGDGFFTVGELERTAYICEGLGQAWAVHAATGCAAVVSFGAGRMRTVAAALQRRGASVLLVPDKGKEAQASEIARVFDCAWCELPTDAPQNYGADDYALEHGPEALAALLKQTKTPPTRFRLLSAADLANAPPLRWLVRGALPAEGLAALYGPSGSGKSFLVLDMAAAVADATAEWFERRASPANVTYCALEGEAGLGKRLTAWSQHHKKPIPERLRFITEPFDLLALSDVAELCKAIKAAGGAGGMVIIDTLNRSAPGADENSSVDMGNLISAAKQLQSSLGGLVLLVHHTGKDAAKGLRGHSSLFAALDAAIEVHKTDTRREWTIAKSKDDETGAAHAFRLDVVPLGFDEDGEITSCVIVPDESREKVRRVVLPQGGNQLVALNALAAPLRESNIFGKPGAIPGRPCLELEEAVRIVAASLAVEPKRRNERARDALTGLVSRGIYGLHDGWIWRAD